MDFQGLFEVDDLPYFSDVLTKQERDKLSASRPRDRTDQLSISVVQCLRKKTLDQVQKVPDCLRKAGKAPLARELEDARQKQIRKRTSKAEVSSTTPQYANIPVEAEQTDEGELTFVPSGGMSEHGTSCASQSSSSTNREAPSHRGKLFLHVKSSSWCRG